MEYDTGTGERNIVLRIFKLLSTIYFHNIFWTSWFCQSRVSELEFFLRGLLLLKMEMPIARGSFYQFFTRYPLLGRGSAGLASTSWSVPAEKSSFRHLSFIHLKKNYPFFLLIKLCYWPPWLWPTVLPFSFSWQARCRCSHLIRWG